MRRATIATLTNNADAAALETARAALTDKSGAATMPGAKVAFSVSTVDGEQILSNGGRLVGFAYVPTTVPVDGSVTARRWMRCSAFDVDLGGGSQDELSAPREVPPGASRAIALPMGVSDSAGTPNTTFPCGIFMQAPSYLG